MRFENDKIYEWKLCLKFFNANAMFNIKYIITN